jgi:hypothetical protein
LLISYDRIVIIAQQPGHLATNDDALITVSPLIKHNTEPDKRYIEKHKIDHFRISNAGAFI